MLLGIHLATVFIQNPENSMLASFLFPQLILIVKHDSFQLFYTKFFISLEYAHVHLRQ